MGQSLEKLSTEIPNLVFFGFMLFTFFGYLRHRDSLLKNTFNDWKMTVETMHAEGVALIKEHGNIIKENTIVLAETKQVLQEIKDEKVAARLNGDCR